MPVERWLRADAMFPGLSVTLRRRIVGVTLRRFYDWDYGQPLPSPQAPTAEQCYRVPDAVLLAEYNVGRRKLAHWHAWKVAHPLAADPDWLAEE